MRGVNRPLTAVAGSRRELYVALLRAQPLCAGAPVSRFHGRAAAISSLSPDNHPVHRNGAQYYGYYC